MRGEAVAGADHLHRRPPSRRAAVTASTTSSTEVGRRHGAGLGGLQARPVLPLHATSLEPPGRRARGSRPGDVDGLRRRGGSRGQTGDGRDARANATRYAAMAPWASITTPARAAPGASPAAMPGVHDRDALGEPRPGDHLLGGGHRGDQGRRDREPATKRASAHHRPSSRRTTIGSITRASATLPTWTRNTAGRRQARVPVTQPGQHAAERPTARAGPRRRTWRAARRRTRRWPPRPREHRAERDGRPPPAAPPSATASAAGPRSGAARGCGSGWVLRWVAR